MRSCYSCVHNGKKHKECISCKSASNYEKQMKFSFSLDSLNSHARSNYERLFAEFVPDPTQRDKLASFFAYLYGLSNRDKVIAINWIGEGCKVTSKLRRELGESYLFLTSTIQRIRIVEFLQALQEDETPPTN